MFDVRIIPYFGTLFRIIVMVAVGIPLLYIVRNSIQSLLDSKRLSKHVGIILQKTLFFGGLVFIGVTILQELGFNIAALLGTAGVIGVAVGFAAKTSVSNIISGFFLLLERPFSLGDMISCSGITGIAESIDLLSVKIRTRDNRLIRLPNEMVLRQRVDTLTYYKNRRIDLIVSVPYKTDVAIIESMIDGIAQDNDLFLNDPHPVVLFDQTNFPSLSNEVRLFLSIRVWVRSENIRMATALLIKKIKQFCDEQNIIVTITRAL